MERPLVGSVVVVEFPYSGFEGAKKRPALCIGYSGTKDIILCQITSQDYHHEDTVVEVISGDFSRGRLPVDRSFIRPDKIFTFETEKVLRIAGKLHQVTVRKVGDRLRKIFEDVLEKP